MRAPYLIPTLQSGELKTGIHTWMYSSVHSKSCSGIHLNDGRNSVNQIYVFRFSLIHCNTEMTKISTISLLHDDTHNMHLGKSSPGGNFFAEFVFPFPYLSFYWQHWKLYLTTKELEYLIVLCKLDCFFQMKRKTVVFSAMSEAEIAYS